MESLWNTVLRFSWGFCYFKFSKHLYICMCIVTIQNTSHHVALFSLLCFVTLTFNKTQSKIAELGNSLIHLNFTEGLINMWQILCQTLGNQFPKWWSYISKKLQPRIKYYKPCIVIKVEINLGSYGITEETAWVQEGIYAVCGA